MNPAVNSFFENGTRWRGEFAKLRKIVLGCGLTEELKWMHPCYTVNRRNVVLIQGFKGYCALLFVKGALLRDRESILIQQTENVQAARQIRFTNVGEIAKMESTLKAFIKEAVDVEKAGLEVKLKTISDFAVPDEFQKQLRDAPALRTAFEALTPGRQKGYLLYFSAPKRPSTREARIQKCLPLIFDGMGLNDRK